MSSTVFLACSKCHEMVVKSTDGDIKIRTKILLFSEDGTARAVCKGCNEEIPIPVKLDVDMVKSLAKEKSPPLYLSSFSGQSRSK